MRSSRSPSPLPVEEWLAFEQAIRAIDNAASRIRFGEEPLDQRGLEDLDVPFDSWLRGLDLPPKSRDFLMAWAGFFFGAPCSGGLGPADPLLGGGVREQRRGLVRGGEREARRRYGRADQLAGRGLGGRDQALGAGGRDRESRRRRHGDHSRRSDPHRGRRGGGDADQHLARAVGDPDAQRGQVGDGDGSGWPATRPRSGPWCAMWAATSTASAGTRRSSGWPPSTRRPRAISWSASGPLPEELDVTDSRAVADAVREFLPDAEVVSTDATTGTPTSSRRGPGWPTGPAR